MKKDCPACGSASNLFFKSRLKAAVRSDWTAVPANIEIWHCSDCGHLFKTPEMIAPWVNYEDYRMWDGHPNQDKMTFDTGFPKSRSSTLVEHMRRTAGLKAGERVLDFGCSHGALLAELGRGHAGLEVSEKYRSDVESLGCSFHTPGAPPPPGAFDWVTLIHVYEHLKDPNEDFKSGLAALKASGRVLIQVPDPIWQPSDFYVIDHYSHFSVRSLLISLARSGLSPCAPIATVLAGEFSAVLSRGTLSSGDLPATPSKDEMNSLLSALETGEQTLERLRDSGQPCVIYGAGLVGTLLAQMLNGRGVAVADHKQPRHRTQHRGKP
jgi:SAM-dependent methyltransferase